jgi:hypothetical protein
MSDEAPHPKARASGWILHYTDADGFKAIISQQTWTFKAKKPPGGRPGGADFTRLLPDNNKLNSGTMLPRRKREYVFAFEGEEGLEPVPGGKGDYNLWTSGDYPVPPGRQKYKGLAEELP